MLFQTPFTQKLLLIFILFAGLSVSVRGQQHISSLPYTNFWQTNALNPAAFPKDKRLAIGLPSINIKGSHTGSLTLNDLYYTENGTRYINFDRILSKIEPVNTADYQQRLEFVSLGLRLPFFKKTMITAGHAIRIDGNVTYSNTLPGLFWKGNAQYIGQLINIAPTFDYHDFHEFSLGFVREVGKVQIGVKGKLYTGISVLQTDESARTIEIYTNPDVYQLQMTTNYGLSSSGIISAIDTSKLGFDLVYNQLSNQLNGKNRGMGIDLGIVAPVTDRLTIQASLLDLGGSIEWKDQSFYLNSRGTYNYDGVFIPGSAILTGGSDIDFSVKLDTLNDIFKFEKTSSTFKTKIRSSGYLSGAYQLTRRLTIGVSGWTRYGGDQVKASVGIFSDFQPFKWLNLGATYILDNRSPANLGLRIGINKGGIQGFVASDNTISSLGPRQTTVLNLRAGIAFVY